ncbi:hypothetical protein GCM10010124_27670 [Pilimelia terevasa]|uniref:Signal peptidase I n=1 Tax=Pilimelia terevasa TaxID=53372 RepID=A0A8J3BTG0_9ACTN|nr:signal peptidase I [Pilimelia terevasa]GGK33392.1 hypothetical protein GCM10010124_27670 [Pilimelia terevasa]
MTASVRTRRTVRHRLHRAFLALTMSVSLAFLAASVGIMATQGRVEAVLSGSMEPTIPTHALVVAVPVAADHVRVGDVIMFQRPDATAGAPSVMHRVVERFTRDGASLAHTRGDANSGNDPWTLDLNRSALYRVNASVPRLGALYQGLHRSVSDLGAARLWGGIALMLVAGAVASRLLRRRATVETAPAEAADEDLTEAVRLASQEMRHRLTTIIGYGEVLSEAGDAMPARESDMARRINDHALRLTGVLDDLTDLVPSSR